jgi:uncharacterized protein (TIGR00730 family)
MKICLFGAASPQIDPLYTEAVESLGVQMAKRGHTMIYGAGATGLMGAAARGMEKEKGDIIGIAPRFFDKPGVLYREHGELIFTDTMRERKGLMEEKADAFLMVPGGIGTFEEFFEVLTLNQLGQMKKPIAVYNINGYFDTLYMLLKQVVSAGFAEKEILELFTVHEDPEILLKELEQKAI